MSGLALGRRGDVKRQPCRYDGKQNSCYQSKEYFEHGLSNSLWRTFSGHISGLVPQGPMSLEIAHNTKIEVEL